MTAEHRAVMAGTAAALAGAISPRCPRPKTDLEEIEPVAQPSCEATNTASDEIHYLNASQVFAAVRARPLVVVADRAGHHERHLESSGFVLWTLGGF